MFSNVMTILLMVVTKFNSKIASDLQASYPGFPATVREKITVATESDQRRISKEKHALSGYERRIGRST